MWNSLAVQRLTFSCEYISLHLYNTMPTHHELLDALADRTRRDVFGLLGQRSLCVGELADRLPVSQPAVSQHLRVLLDAGLVRVEKRGRRRIYHVRAQGLEPLRRYVESFWDEALGAFQASFRPSNGAE